jgi:hypothetical protein
MLPTGTLFDRYGVRDWTGAQVQTSKYFLGLAAGTMGHVVGTLEVSHNQLLLVVEWESTDATARRMDCFSQSEAEQYLLRVLAPTRSRSR